MPSRLIIPGATAFSRFLLREAAEWVAKGGLDGSIGKAAGFRAAHAAPLIDRLLQALFAQGQQDE